MGRLDRELIIRRLVESRTKGQMLISQGMVLVNGKVIHKPSYPVNPDDEIVITGTLRFVARSGQKLEHALETFGLDVRDKTCLDIGSSTGGFTDCLLQHGARKVYAVDVGTAQLHPRVASDKRVISLENTDARDLNKKLIPDPIDIFVADLSFISAVKVLPHILPLTRETAKGVLLIKPQFELSPAEVKGGVVTSRSLHTKAILNVTQGLRNHGLFVERLTYSPIKGGSGNIEFLGLLTRNHVKEISMQEIEEVVNQAHKILKQ